MVKVDGWVVFNCGVMVSDFGMYAATITPTQDGEQFVLRLFADGKQVASRRRDTYEELVSMMRRWESHEINL